MNPGSTDIASLFQKARTLSADGHLTQSCTTLMQILQLDPGNAQAAFETAEILYHHFKQTERALNYYDQAIRLDPENDRPVVAKSVVLLGMGRTKEAQEIVDRFLAAPAFSARGWLRKGILLQTHQRQAEALQAYRTAAAKIKESPSDYEICRQAMFHLADLLAFLKKDQEAAQWFAAYLRLRPNDPDALRGYACVLNSMGNNDEAVSVLWHYLKLRPQETWPYLSMARIYAIEEKKYEEGLEALHRYETSENSPRGRALAAQMRGEIEETRGRLKEAAEALEKSAALNNQDPHTYYCLARVLRALGDKPKALTMAKKAASLGQEEIAYSMALERLQESMLLISRAEASIRTVLNKLNGLGTEPSKD